MGLLFNGSDGYLASNATNLALGFQITLFAWIKAATIGENSNGAIFWCGADTTERFGLSLAAGPVLEFRAKWSTTEGKWTCPIASLSGWHFVAVTYSYSSTANIPKLYVDGVSQTVTTVTTPAGSAPADSKQIFLGNRGGRDRTFDGIISDAGGYSVILSDDEVLTIYLLGPLVLPDGLYLWWPLWYGLARDFSGNGRAGTSSFGPTLDADAPIPFVYGGGPAVARDFTYRMTPQALSFHWDVFSPTVRVLSAATPGPLEIDLSMPVPTVNGSGSAAVSPDPLYIGWWIGGDGTAVSATDQNAVGTTPAPNPSPEDFARGDSTPLVLLTRPSLLDPNVPLLVTGLVDINTPGKQSRQITGESF